MGPGKQLEDNRETIGLGKHDKNYRKTIGLGKQQENHRKTTTGLCQEQGKHSEIIGKQQAQANSRKTIGTPQAEANSRGPIGKPSGNYILFEDLFHSNSFPQDFVPLEIVSTKGPSNKISVPAEFCSRETSFHSSWEASRRAGIPSSL